MKPFCTASLLFLGVFIPSSWSSPVGQASPNDLGPLARRSSPQCSASYIQSAESKANKSYCKTISTLCSSLQGKYKTVTHSVYTTTVTPKTTVDVTSTAPRPVRTGTATVEVTQTDTDYETSTSVAFVTEVATETLTVETDVATVTLVPRGQWPCQQIESLLSLPASSATPFCSCYESGTTSTTTVTCKGATTAPAARVTDHATITPSPSTVYTTVYQTTSVVVTEETGVVVTSTVVADVTLSVTDFETTTVSPPQPLSTGFLQVQNSASPYNNFYAFYDLNSNAFFKLQSDKSAAKVFNIDTSGHLNGGGTEVTAAQDAYGGGQGYPVYLNLPSTVAFYESLGINVQPTCTTGPVLNQLSCAETGTGDLRHVLLICPPASATDYPTLLLDTGPYYNCEIAQIFFVPSS